MNRCPLVGLVIEYGEWQRESVRTLPDREAMITNLAKYPPRALGKGFPADTRNSLWRTESHAGSANEQDPRQLL
jgi:hypothetical protein